MATARQPRKRYPCRYRCLDCDSPTVRFRRSDQPKVCRYCGIDRAVAAVHAIVQRDGPAWEAHQRNPGGRPRKSPPPTE